MHIKFVNCCLKTGKMLFGIDNLNDAYDVRIKNWRLEQLKKFSNFKFVKQDICNFDGLRKLIEGQDSFDAVINLAARAGVRASVEDPWTYVDTNVNGTLNLLEICQRYEIKKFILASTSKRLWCKFTFADVRRCR